MDAIKIIVRGRVQGVSFRYYTKKEADKLNLKGYVKNLDDGSVEIIAEGEKENLDKIISFAKIGSPYAKVEEITIEKIKPSQKFKDFFID